ncbi:hypothetical protein ABZ348_12840 [Streptomyces sp. NPDC005963]|uniref:hypothetical protein n=1 Tax=Streptomyces sp. NPDC005963 TaxID=3156721 RepID=UPI003406F8CB
MSSAFGGSFTRRWMTVEGIDIEVRRGPAARGRVDSCRDFVWWPVQIELEPSRPEGEARMVDSTRCVLAALWAAEAQAVAACDYEDELPWQGGSQLLGD